MRKKLKTILAFLCVVCLFANSTGLLAAAYEDETAALQAAGKIDREMPIWAQWVKKVALASDISFEDYVSSDGTIYKHIPVYINGVLAGIGYRVEDSTYVPIRTYCTRLDESTSVSWDPDQSLVTVEAAGLSLSLNPQKNYLQANGRYFYMPYGVMEINDSYYVPVRELSRAFGAEVVWDEELQCVFVSTEGAAYIESGDTFYNEEDLYWLSRLIYSESGNQPLDGKIGVGNVVLNRVESPLCPDTIYDVIFDTKHGVQFSVILNGSIYLEPSEEAVIAAKICFEGYETVGDSLYFLNPDIASTGWFASTRTFVVSLGDHDFYA